MCHARTAPPRGACRDLEGGRDTVLAGEDRGVNHGGAAVGHLGDMADGADQNERSSLLVQAPAC
jgi:hypothetical protein